MKPEALVLRFLLGAIAGVLVTNAYLHGINEFWMSGLLTSATAIGLGIWIHGSLHRRSVVGRIPMDHIADSSRKINELLRKCADAARSPHRGVVLRQLSNEISWFLEIPRVIRPVPAHLEENLLASYFEFKGYLTWESPPNPSVVDRMVRQVQARVLEFEVCFTTFVLERGVKPGTQ